MVGIAAIGVYLPRTRLARKAIVDANQWFAVGLSSLAKGERTVCSWDEDAITMGVEAVRSIRADCTPASLWFASTSAPFQDRLNAGVVATAADLAENVAALDVTGSLRSGTTALGRAIQDAASGGEAIVVASEQRLAKAGGQEELLFGDAATAVVISSRPGLAEILAMKHRSVDFVDHYRASTMSFDYAWEERWTRDQGYLKIVPPVISELLAEAKVEADKIDRFIMPAPSGSVAFAIASRAGIRPDAVCDVLQERVGFSGSAHPLLMLAAVLEEATPGQLILLIGFGQGCDTFLLKVAKTNAKTRLGSFASQLARGRTSTNYMRHLSHNQLIEQERGIRAELDTQTPPTVLYRNRRMLYGFIGGKCRKCGAVQFPKTPVCVNPNCGAYHEQEDYGFADSEARVQSFTADQLTYTPDPPARYGMMKFAAGGCLMMDLTDVADGEIAVGVPVRMMFRIKTEDERRGFKRYFWKAAPVTASA
jgi:3-hydroxy-3-methylglutaryl CoA synthase